MAFPASSMAASSSGAQVWLALSDIHLDLFDRSPTPSSYDADPNLALFESALARMKRAEPNPAVVLLPGDFLMHDFRGHLRPGEGPAEEAQIRTMRWIAGAFAQAFPKAQFAIAIGNNDAPCGDYRSADGSAYLRRVAAIWAPLVDRRGASPAFASSFARGGYYTAALPIHGLRLVVLNTVPFSSQYRGNCGFSEPHAASQQLNWLQATLRATPSNSRTVVMMHIPPGFDAFSTEYVHGFLAWPYLKSQYTQQLADALSSPRSRIAYAIAGHAHRFDFRLAGNVPIVVLGALSALFANNPTFYALKVAPDGSLRDMDLYAFDERSASWEPPRSFDRLWHVAAIDGDALDRLHRQLAESAGLRARWDAQSIGWVADPSLRGTWNRGTWRVAWCAQRVPTPDFATCAGIATRVWILPILLAAAAGVTLLIVLAVLRARVRS